jgi:hypothetical protein
LAQTAEIALQRAVAERRARAGQKRLISRHHEQRRRVLILCVGCWVPRLLRLLRERARGRLYHQQGSAICWMAFYKHGKQIRMSTGEVDEKKVERALKLKLQERDAEPGGAEDGSA